MLRTIPTLLSLALLAGPAAAASYSATLVSPTSGRFIARDIVWSCGPTACQGTTEESRPVVLCESLAKRAGRIDSFLVDGRAFTGAELQECNASVKGRTPALAAQ
ncbi:MAG TPA: hypothetical protein VIV07_10615 [Sphingomicrobium sp.]